jgi:hypothetical protein
MPARQNKKFLKKRNIDARKTAKKDSEKKVTSAGRSISKSAIDKQKVIKKHNCEKANAVNLRFISLKDDTNSLFINPPLS